jgi:H+/Cl- antiporter ClcA
MSPNLMGAIVGFFVGLMGYLFIRLAAARVESKGVTKEPAKTAQMLRTVALIDLIFFVVAGYFVGPMIASSATS